MNEQGYGPLRPTCEEDVFKRLVAQVEALGGVWTGGARMGGQLYALLRLYARMLVESDERFNETPTLHRHAFLKLQQHARRPAQPAQTLLLFQVSEGYDRVVHVPAGTLASAPGEDGMVQYRTKYAFDAVPARLEEVVWCDRRLDTVCHAAPDQMPLALWSLTEGGTSGHLVDFSFEHLFTAPSGKQQAFMTLELRRDGEPVDIGLLADTACFCWSLWSKDAEGVRVRVPMQVEREPLSERLMLTYGPAPDLGTSVWLRLELLDPAWVGLELSAPCVRVEEREIVPDLVQLRDCAARPERFYPFGSPLQPPDECQIFCANALVRKGAEIWIDFHLRIEETTELLPPVPEPELKWVMRQPPSEPPPEPAQARAQDVSWTYWDGRIYRSLPFLQPAKTQWMEEGPVHLAFSCPEDLDPEGVDAVGGYVLRLSCGVSEEVYRIPRRTYTPVLERLTLGYCYNIAPVPLAVYGENFGERERLQADAQGFYRPFAPPPFERALCFGFDWLPPDTRLQIYLQTDEKQYSAKRAYLTARMHGVELPTDDRTAALFKSGALSVLLPADPKPQTLFGTTRYWICLPCPKTQSPRRLDAVHLNAQVAENRVRHTYELSFDSLQRDCRFRLPHTDIVMVWVYARDGEHWERWREHTPMDGSLREGCFKADYQSGWITLPEQIKARFVRDPGEDFVRIIYDVCDGARGNCDVGVIGRLTEEVAYLSGVTNPLPACGGEDSEPEEVWLDRSAHFLYHGGHAVTARDYEQMALDLCPCLHDARCLPGRPVRLAVLTKDAAQDFSMVLAALGPLYTLGCTQAAETSLELTRAVELPMQCHLVLAADRHLFSNTRQRFTRLLTAFLHPVTGGVDHKGWRIGRLPTYAQMEAYLAAITPPFRVARLELFALRDGSWVDWSKDRASALEVPGPVQIEMEVLKGE